MNIFYQLFHRVDTEGQALELIKSITTWFFLLFPTEAAAADAVAKVKALGFDAEITAPAPGRQWPVRAQESMVLTEEALKRTRYHFDRIARAGQGSYEGWGAPPVT